MASSRSAVSPPRERLRVCTHKGLRRWFAGIDPPLGTRTQDMGGICKDERRETGSIPVNPSGTAQGSRPDVVAKSLKWRTLRRFLLPVPPFTIRCHAGSPSPFPWQEGTRGRWVAIGKRSRRPRGTGRATPWAAFQGPRPRCRPLAVHQHRFGAGALPVDHGRPSCAILNCESGYSAGHDPWAANTTTLYECGP